LIKRALLLTFCFVVSNVPYSSGYGATVLVTAKDSKISTVSKQNAKQVYLGKVRTLPDVGPVSRVNLPSSSNEYKRFLKKIIKKSPRQLRSYWSLHIFTGRGGTPPKTLSSKAEVKTWLASTPNGLAYMSSDDLDSSLKVVLSID